MSENKKAKMPDNDWHDFFVEECHKPYFKELNKRLGAEYINHEVYPPIDKVFNAFELTPYSNIKCVIIGQDPYHEPGQAMGLCFSVPEGIEIPPSLRNIYKEMHEDIGFEIPQSGDLTSWARQGVLLLNATLTVRRSAAASHAALGWQTFTDSVISYIDRRDEPVVFLLWGGFAQKKASLLQNNEHRILYAAHPSPLSAYRGFFGCRHFSAANSFLLEKGIAPVDWSL